MKLLLAAVICALAMASPVGAQQARWPVFAVDKQLTLRFPAQPQEMDVPSTMAAFDAPTRNTPRVQQARAFRFEDALATYVLVCVPVFEAPKLSPSFSVRSSYYKSRVIPLLISQAHGQLLAQHIGQQQGTDVVTLQYRALDATGSPTVKYLRMLTIGQTVYQLYFVPKDKTGANCKVQRSRFFDSIRIGQ
jgi:hypothetical protein